MSIPVELDVLEAKTAEYGVAYLLTVTDSLTPKIVALRPKWDGDEMVAHAGGGSVRNIAQRAAVTLAYPPLDPDGHTLIVDGEASVDGDVSTSHHVRFRPTGAVLHRAAPEGFVNTTTGCSHDCAPVTAD